MFNPFFASETIKKLRTQEYCGSRKRHNLLCDEDERWVDIEWIHMFDTYNFMFRSYNGRCFSMVDGRMYERKSIMDNRGNRHTERFPIKAKCLAIDECIYLQCGAGNNYLCYDTPAERKE